ncbi:DUF3097 family protein, partial [Streptomyces sp. URMC 128]|uniref:DUF3097 family protein n=1 Tax=Streptomyces sp. URMC 128 TaxID=3423404 RepID=UPI003F1D1BEC
MRQYSPDLTPPWKKPQPVPEVPAEPGLVVEEPGTGFCGAVIRCEAGTVTLEDRFGKHRVFPLEPRGFLLEGRVDFSEATFSDGRIYLTGARFTGGIV